MAWNQQLGRMYYIDSPTKSVVSFAYEPESGEISSPSIALQTPESMGSPDGMTIDDEGMLWIAFYRGGCVARWNPETGRMLSKIEIPAPNVTSCCFGGPGMDTLYVTTARQKMGADALAEYPLAGGIFSLRPGVSGSPSYRFKG
jgi:sugar lactone lactonase YvrE